MRLIKYQPRIEQPWADFERLFEAGWRNFPLLGFDRRAYGPRGIPVDVYETESGQIYRMEMPGVSKDEVKVELEKSVLKVSVKRTEGDGENRTETELVRSLRVSDDMDAGTIKAKLDNGILTVTVDKREQAQPQYINIE